MSRHHQASFLAAAGPRSAARYCSGTAGVAGSGLARPAASRFTTWSRCTRAGQTTWATAGGVVPIVPHSGPPAAGDSGASGVAGVRRRVGLKPNSWFHDFPIPTY